jgi:hypothetical protein
VLVCAVALAAARLPAGCPDLGDVTYSFEVRESLPEMTVPGDPTGGELSGVEFETELSIAGEPEFLSEEFDEVLGVVVTGATLKVAPSSADPEADRLEDGSPDDLSFLHSVAVHVEAVVEGERRRELVARLPEGGRGPEGLRTVGLQTQDVDVIDFIEAQDGYSMTIELEGAVPADDVVLEGEITYEVTVAVLSL